MQEKRMNPDWVYRIYTSNEVKPFALYDEITSTHLKFCFRYLKGKIKECYVYLCCADDGYLQQKQ